jgi:thiol-disulfide isomerase/thioredoxin
MRIVWGYIKPVAGVIVVLMLLKYTGLLGGVSYVAQSALLKTGIRNADAENDERVKDFDYNFSIRSLDGNKIDFNEFKGKVVFLNLWATWCGPCRAEMAGIQDLYSQLNNDQVYFVMLSLDKSEHKQKIIDYIKKSEFTFPAYTPSGYLPEQLQVPSIPTTFIISKSGKVVSTEIGATNFNTRHFKKYLSQLAAE